MNECDIKVQLMQTKVHGTHMRINRVVYTFNWHMINSNKCNIADAKIKKKTTICITLSFEMQIEIKISSSMNLIKNCIFIIYYICLPIVSVCI